MAPWRSQRATHDPGKVLLDLATAVALGGDCAADIAVVRAQPDLFGAVASDPTLRSELNHKAETMIAEDFVNAYLFQLAKTGVANAKIQGLWENSPTQANDLTGVSWSE